MQKLLGVSAVSYLNTAPFIYGLRNSDVINEVELMIDYPSECARKLNNGEVEIGLVPVVAVLNNPNLHIISDYCIGSTEYVRTVALFSNSPLDQIKRVYLDYQSLTSVMLIKILAKNLWKKSFEWEPLTQGHSFEGIEKHEGVLAIGDKVFGLEGNFLNNIDLASEWKRLTGLPMVFAVWASRNSVDKGFVSRFNVALKAGVDSIERSVDAFQNLPISKAMAISYLKNNISYTLKQDKKEAVSLFGKFINKINISGSNTF